MDWNNKDNNQFYEVVEPQAQEHYSTIGGMSDYPDLLLLTHYIEKADSILEVGAGYGRVLEFLKAAHYQREVVALERSKQFFNILRDRFNNFAELIHGDVMEIPITKKFDLVLSLWSVITHFQPKEQLQLISRLQQMLSENGVLVIDTVSYEHAPLNYEHLNAPTNNTPRTYLIEQGEGKLNGYTPLPDEMRSYAEQLSFQHCRHIPYHSSTGRVRHLYIMQ